MNPSPGLVDILQSDEQKIALNNVAWNLDVLCAGRIDGYAPVVLEFQQSLNRLLTECKNDYKFIILDSPPVNGKSTAIRLASLVDDVILVIEAERTRRETVRRAKEQLLQVRANILGIVLNKRRFPIPNYLYRKQTEIRSY